MDAGAACRLLLRRHADDRHLQAADRRRQGRSGCRWLWHQQPVTCDAVDHGTAALFRWADGLGRQQFARLSKLLRHDSNWPGSECRTHRRILCSRRGAKAKACNGGARISRRRILAQSDPRREGERREIRLPDRPRGHLSADDRRFCPCCRRRGHKRLRSLVSLLLSRGTRSASFEPSARIAFARRWSAAP